MRRTVAPFRLGSVVLLAFAGALAACDDVGSDFPCICTEEYRSYHLRVVDGAGIPADGVAVRVLRVQTAEWLDYGSPEGSPGTYLVMDDLFSDRIAADESFEVTGVRGEASFAVEFRFGTDSCRCHVLMLAGPESVTLQP